MKTEEAANIWRNVNSHPTVVSGVLCSHGDDSFSLKSTWKQINVTSGKHVTFARNHYMSDNSATVASSGSDQIDRQWCIYNKSGTKKVVIRKEKFDKESKQYIEVWASSRLLQCISVSDLKGHGDICDNDGVFGSVCLSDDEKTLLYVAASKANKSRCFFDAKPPKSTTSASSDKEEKEEQDMNVVGGETNSTADRLQSNTFAPVGDKYVYKDTWGEQMTDKIRMVTCLLDLDTLNVNVLDSFYFSMAQSIFCNDEKSILCLGYEDMPYRLGRIYCTNRESTLYVIDPQTSNYTVVGPQDKAIRSPSFSPDKSVLVWLENDIGGPHFPCNRLVVLDWKTKTISYTVQVVKRTKSMSQFPGIFTANLTARCWTEDSKKIVICSHWHSAFAIVSINVENGKIQRLTGGYELNSKKLETNFKPSKHKKETPKSSLDQDSDDVHYYGNFKLLDIYKDRIVAVRSTPCQPQYLVWAALKEDNEGILNWKPVDFEDFRGTKLNDIKWSVGAIKYADHQDPYEYTIVESKASTKSKSPLVVWSHGGPHSVTPIDYIPTLCGLVKCGFAVLAVNYRGSTGFGEIQLKSLCGNIGSQEIQDVQNCVKKVIGTGNYDESKVVCIGGSHGGFISSHLIGQYPSFYRAACMRNPVIDLCSMYSTSDIPDWVMVESDLKYDYGTVLVAEDYRRLYKKSPIRYVNHVKTPVLLLLGEDDIRVPTSQGLSYRRALLAKDVECRTLMYCNNNHPISGVEADSDCFMNIIHFIVKHTSGDPPVYVGQDDDKANEEPQESSTRRTRSRSKSSGKLSSRSSSPRPPV